MMTATAGEILIVEDNPSDLELTLYTLRQHGIANHVHVARDGAEALAYLFESDGTANQNHARSLRVILLDVKLPCIDGIEVLRAIKSTPETCAIPVVMLTSSREERDIVDSYRLGANSYISKPVDFEQFSETVRQLGIYWLLLNLPPVQ